MGEVKALQAVLAGAHAALWGYAVVGARLEEGADENRALADHAAVRELRDTVIGLIIGRDAEPEAARTAYALPFPVEDTASARRLAVHLEDRLAPLLGDLVAAAESAKLRRLTGDALSASAVRRIGWDAEPTAFPGLGQS